MLRKLLELLSGAGRFVHQRPEHQPEQDADQHDAGDRQQCALPLEFLDQRLGQRGEDRRPQAGTAHRDAGRQGSQSFEVHRDAHDRGQIDQSQPEPGADADRDEQHEHAGRVHADRERGTSEQRTGNRDRPATVPVDQR